MLDGLVLWLSASGRWQTWAFSTPLVRAIARRRALGLFDLCAGFVHSQVLAACVELDLFARLMARPRDAETVAREGGLSVDGARRLLDAAVALGLLRRRGERYGVGPLGAPLAAPGSGVAAMIAHHGRLYADLADPLAIYRPDRAGGALQGFWAYGADPADVGAAAPYSALMAASQDFVAADVLDALRGAVPKGLRWLDLGGGEGRFLIEAARRDRRLSGTVLDLAPVAELARARIGREGLQARLRAVGADARDPAAVGGAEVGAAAALAGGFEVVSLVRVLHDHDDEAALALLRAARAALAPGGRLVIAEPMRGGTSDPRISDAYFGPYLLAMGQGRLRHPAEIARLAAAAGFAPPRERATRRPFLTRLMILDCQPGLTS